MKPAPDSDYSIIQGSIDHPQRFAAIFDRHYDAVFRYATARLPRTVAEDVASETFVIAFRARMRFRKCPSALPWLIGISQNVAKQAISTDVRWREVSTTEHAAQSNSTDGFEHELEIDEALVAALHALTDADRETILLRVWDDLSYEDIARTLNVPVGTVRSRINRARRQLQDHLNPSRQTAHVETHNE